MRERRVPTGRRDGFEVTVWVETVEPALAWCRENLPQGHGQASAYHQNGGYRLTLRFRSEQDAALFKLFWDNRLG